VSECARVRACVSVQCVCTCKKRTCTHAD